MAVIDTRTAAGLGARSRRDADGLADVAARPWVPAAAALAIAVGLLYVVLSTPIAARGDYGQWLMTARWYLGDSVPSYRTIWALPPAVPLLLAGVQLFVSDPVLVLHLADALLLVLLLAAFYLCGSWILGSPWAGVFGMVLGFLGTDRFFELFAFGGMLQVASLAAMMIGVAAFARASREAEIVPGWWLLGTAAVGMAAMSHVGTAMVAVPVCVSAAAISLLKYRRDGRRSLRKALVPLTLVLAGVGAYWIVVLLPASRDYLTNPASVAYRGPGKLLDLLFSYWPTTVVAVGGISAIALGLVGEIAHRRRGGHVLLLVWVSLCWGAFLYTAASDAATDYPRFATLLLAPLVVAAGEAVVWLIGSLRSYLRDLGVHHLDGMLLPLVLVALLAVATPLSIDRHARQTSIYQPRDAASLTASAQWIAAQLSDPSAAVLTEVARDGKWLEGLTGSTSLFSQPVRYAFRPIEWERSIAADALLRSTDAVTSGYVTAAYTSLIGQGAASVPSDLIISANHGGEFVDVLRIPSSTTLVIGDNGAQDVASLPPVRTVRKADAESASIQSVSASGEATTFTQSVTAWRDGSALAINEASPTHRLSTTLQPAAGMTITSLTVDGADAVACFTRVGDTAPCVRIHVTQPDAWVKGTSYGAIQIATTKSDRLDLLVTALTAGDASVGLELLDPAQLAERYHVGAALLYAPDPAYRERAARLAAIGFQEARAFGPYRVLMRSGGAVS